MMTPTTLEQLLNRRDTTQAQLARDLGTERGVIHSWIQRGRIPAERLAAVCVALGASADEAVRLYRESGVELPSVLHGETVAPDSAAANP